MGAVALAGACIIRHRQDPSRDGYFTTAVVLLFIVGTSKLPYMVLTLPLLAYPLVTLSRRIILVVASVALSLAWHIYVATHLPAIWPYDPASQISNLMNNPLGVVPIAIETLTAFGRLYVHQAVGILGWLDAPVPVWFVACACVALILTFISAGVSYDEKRRAHSVFVSALIASALISAALVFGSMYVVWTPAGSTVVDGVQGRYFLPVLAVLPVAIALSSIRWDVWFLSMEERPMKVMLMAYVFLTVYVTISTTLGRYYA